MTAEGRENARRLTMVVVALLIAGGSVLLMRMVAQYIAGAVTPEPVSRNIGRIEAGVNAPRIHDLQKLLPEICRYSFLGRSCRREETHHLMPVELLKQVKHKEALANGWKPLQEHRDLPASAVLALQRANGAYYETNDGRFVTRQFWAESPESSGMVEIDLPDTGHFGCEIRQPEEGKEPEEPDIIELAAPASVGILQQMPMPLYGTFFGEVVFCVLQPRETGAVFYLNTVTRLTAEETRKRARKAALASGWSRVNADGDFYQKANLSLGFDCRNDAQCPGLTAISYRISDDEVRINKQMEKMNENR